MDRYPPLKLDHLHRLTDDVGIIQHAIYSVPDRRHGYSLDDNARALIVALKHHRLSGEVESLDLAYKYLSFVRHAQLPGGRFHNFLTYDRRWLEEEGSEDSYGRALWSLGYAMASDMASELAAAARDIFDAALPWLDSLRSPRARAFALLGLHWRYQISAHKDDLRYLRRQADSLVQNYRDTAQNDWQWYEEYLTYCNGKLPQALLVAYQDTKAEEYLATGCRSLDFLLEILFVNGRLELIGQGGWYPRKGPRAFFDQQPIDAEATVELCLEAYRVTGKARYYDLAFRAFEWFLGRNRLGLVLYDSNTGGCYDGLEPNGVNQNQGAESTISYLLSYLLLAENAKPAERQLHGFGCRDLTGDEWIE